MKHKSLKRLVLNGLFVAIVFLATYFTRVPTPLPGGYFNLGDTVIFLAAAFMGPVGGMFAGAVGSAIADLAAGALLFAPITFVVIGLDGLVAGLIAAKLRKKDTVSSALHLSLILAVAVGAITMVAGYFFAETFLLGLFDEAFGLTAAITEILPNSVQGSLSALLGYILVLLLSKANFDKLID